ncbi:hypothetical protein T440DRAFT_506820 [Plenodomus tracheiphilus IPT5]|uniref:Regulator of volume decrease after cellular swelling-domain-containing protein n=1 Tax=Plenodomus tracheiphilus IPT5 TaxID=1408161 RepID=A0A6A7B8I3_9PLEO|nr:hypothetical protein T440DRAFT_506820 [Plenodomus tracheiphilus IPT5]
MALRHLSTAPKADDFTPLEEHQQQTPSTFFGAKPVLYAKHSGLTLSALSSQLQQDAAFSKFGSESDGDNALIKDVDIWVSSENLVFFQSSPTPTGVSIPYPAIALHATMKYKSTVEALYMSLSLNDTANINEEDDIQVLELTVLPPSYDLIPETACIKDIFGAMNTCADLHPDPDGSEDGDDDILDESAPGATGWITADNMDEYMDENGNFRGTVLGGEELGPGAGTVRQREDGDEDTNGTNGVEGHEEKYHRTG